jgi:hypothetical protein
MWRFISTLLAVAALTISFPAAGTAQPQPVAGDRLRILTHDINTLFGTFVSSSADAMVLKSGGNERQIDYADIAYLERSSERYLKFWQNFFLTVGSGATVSGFLAAITWKPCVSNQLFGCLFASDSRSEEFIFGLAVGGLIAVPVGVIVGLVLEYDRWEPVSVPALPSSTISIRPVFDGGLGLAASISF